MSVVEHLKSYFNTSTVSDGFHHWDSQVISLIFKIRNMIKSSVTTTASKTVLHCLSQFLDFLFLTDQDHDHSSWEAVQLQQHDPSYEFSDMVEEMKSAQHKMA